MRHRHTPHRHRLRAAARLPPVASTAPPTRALTRRAEFGYFNKTLSVHHKHLHGDVAYCIAMLCNFARPLVPLDEAAEV